MLRAIIIDDEQKGINSLRMIINEFIPDVRVVAETKHAPAAIELIENYKPEIVFLDINMPGMSGFQMLERLSWHKFNLVFVTAHEEYALNALKKNAVDYLLKPIDHLEVQAAVTKIKNMAVVNDIEFSQYNSLLKELNYQGNKTRLLVNTRAGIEPLDFSEIIYLKSKSNYTEFYLTNSKTITASKNLKEFEDLLIFQSSHFMRVHNSFIINVHKVVRYIKAEEAIVMSNDKHIPLSKSRRDVFYEWLNA